GAAASGARAAAAASADLLQAGSPGTRHTRAIHASERMRERLVGTGLSSVKLAEGSMLTKPVWLRGSWVPYRAAAATTVRAPAMDRRRRAMAAWRMASFSVGSVSASRVLARYAVLAEGAGPSCSARRKRRKAWPNGVSAPRRSPR